MILLTDTKVGAIGHVVVYLSKIHSNHGHVESLYSYSTDWI